MASGERGYLRESESARPLINPSVISRRIVADEVVLVNLDTAASLALNSTGVVVWQLVDGERTVEQIIASVRSHFRDVPDTVDDEVIELLDILAKDGFVGFEWTSGPIMPDGQ